ncbi:hypothetical protein PSECIP111951_01508 [Pseudoalteromonas holothuriae]|uniref:DUF1456 domain-containing protein n=1 Tax=Pseudoalteromonas holothuriae TaxID=2963714 RepID=A0A9W4VMA5_9GAMM|nr:MULTISPECIES: DUF1456 family protein [unclassified Pseudoalteromonas]CAH9051186.1 hypothetical protein PSECIP111854_00695 [Pseudoalteromonas sp. CIP111854]CAH9056674.1 hypothetical protein PSECIP111951_01508 [Pseudoalteromonas sp. CIP111951]
MTNNDILRRIRYTFDLNDNVMTEIFSLANVNVTNAQVSQWLKKEEEESFVELSDTELAVFLNGFINLKRGKREGEQPEPEDKLSNNIVFQKLRIALNLKAEDILETLQCVDFRLSKHELSAFFRKPQNKHYRACKDQILRNFLLGLQHQLRPNSNKTES